MAAYGLRVRLRPTLIMCGGSSNGSTFPNVWLPLFHAQAGVVEEWGGGNSNSLTSSDLIGCLDAPTGIFTPRGASANGASGGGASAGGASAGGASGGGASAGNASRWVAFWRVPAKGSQVLYIPCQTTDLPSATSAFWHFYNQCLFNSFRRVIWLECESKVSLFQSRSNKDTDALSHNRSSNETSSSNDQKAVVRD